MLNFLPLGSDTKNSCGGEYLAALEKGELIMECNRNCNNLCPNIVISTSVSLVGTTLVIDIPAATYNKGDKLCLVVAQTIPAATTITAPVAISIGGDTGTLYPVVGCDCAQVTACAMRTRTRYPMRVSTTSTSAVFKVLRGLSCAPGNALASIPAPAGT